MNENEKEKRQKEASEKISEHMARARAEIKAAEKLAAEAEVEFGFDLAYGMGGTFCKLDGEGGEPVYDEDPDEPAQEGTVFGWFASSRSC